jgi:hypothetical protein
MAIHGIGSRRSLLNSPAPSAQLLDSVVLALSPVNATDPTHVTKPVDTNLLLRLISTYVYAPSEA